MMSEPKDPALQLINVTVKFGDLCVVKDVNLHVEHGEVFCIIGPSGEGKTVLLKTMAGIFKPSAGRVLVEGEDWQQLKSREKFVLAEKIGMLFQRSALFDTMTVEQNVMFPMKEHLLLSEDEQRRRANEYLAAVGLAKDAKKYPYELSGGMQRRLGIARALALSPDILFYDDPIAGQDPITSDKIIDLILDLKRRNNSTLVVVTNDMKHAFRMATRIVMVIGGDVIETGSPEQTKNHPDPRVQQFIHGRLQGPIKLQL